MIRAPAGGIRGSGTYIDKSILTSVFTYTNNVYRSEGYQPHNSWESTLKIAPPLLLQRNDKVIFFWQVETESATS